MQVPKVPIKEGRVKEIKGSWAGEQGEQGEQEGEVMEGMWRVAATLLLLTATDLTISGISQMYQIIIPKTSISESDLEFEVKLRMRQPESVGCIATLCSPGSIS